MTVRRRTRLLLVLVATVAVAACGSDDGAGETGDGDDSATEQSSATDADDATGDAAATDDGGAEDDDAVSDESEADEAPSDDAAAAPGGGSGGTATLTLANGETFEFSGLLCALEPQMAAGSEILFTAVSYQDPGLDVTQFGDEGTITTVASISVYDAEYETLWEANSMFGSSVELTLDGTTIRGTGAFLPGGELTGEAVDGELVANC